jgi:hypothetical protein
MHSVYGKYCGDEEIYPHILTDLHDFISPRYEGSFWCGLFACMLVIYLSINSWPAFVHIPYLRVYPSLASV